MKFPSSMSEAFIAAGLVILGAWLAVEIAAIVDRHYSKEDEDA